MNKYIIEKGKYITKIAYLKNETLISADFISEKSRVYEGDIYKAKIVKIIKSMNSATLDLGNGSFAYMQQNDLNDKYKANDDILVQIKREGVKNKFPKAVTEISILGRYVVFLPNSSGLSISNKITDHTLRQVFTEQLKDISFEDFGVILRSISSVNDINNIRNEIYHLLDFWKKILSKSGSKSGVLYTPVSLYQRFILKSNPSSIDCVISNDKELLKNIENDLIHIIKTNKFEFVDTPFLFDYLGLEKKLMSIFVPDIAVDRSISINIDQTEAFTVIDVNSGQKQIAKNFEENVFEINKLAANEAISQIILRNISGIILIDFIDMKTRKYNDQLLEHVQLLLKEDHIKASALSLTQLGIMQIIRKKDADNIYQRYTKKCPLCNESGRVLSAEIFTEELRKRIIMESSHKSSKIINLDIPYTFSKIIDDELKFLENDLGIKIYARYLPDNFQKLNISN